MANHLGYIRTYFDEAAKLCAMLNQEGPATAMSKMVDILIDVRAKGGRLFILGVGGSAGNAGHATNDFR